MAAVNRLDGRQYAVKKIPLDATSPAAHSRIMREVATLSRLQHPHVVRYFQCAAEPYTLILPLLAVRCHALNPGGTAEGAASAHRGQAPMRLEANRGRHPTEPRR